MNCLVLTVDFGERGRGGLIGEGLGWFSITAGGGTPIIGYTGTCATQQWYNVEGGGREG